jgi:heat shock protein HslJ
MRILAVLFLLLAGCATADAPDPDLVGTEWVLASIRGEAPVAKSRITLRFDEAGAGGYGGCNWYGGAYDASGGELEWKEMSSTLRACLDPAAGDQERRFLEAVGAATRYRIEGDRLLLSNGGSAPLLIFTRRAAVPMNPDELLGTRWRLESIDGAPPVGSAPLTIAFPEAGTIRGFAGCREFVSRYRAEGDRIGLTETTMSGTECAAPPDVAVQEGDFTTHLSEVEHYRLSDGRLEMTTAGGATLVFSRM